MCCPRDASAVHSILEESVLHADGHDEVRLGDGRSSPIRRRESTKYKHADYQLAPREEWGLNSLSHPTQASLGADHTRCVPVEMSVVADV